MPIADAAGLILLKLYAGGLQDSWDIEQLLAAAADRSALVATVEAEAPRLPAGAQHLWERLRPKPR